MIDTLDVKDSLVLSQIESELFGNPWNEKQIISHFDSGNIIWGYWDEFRQIQGYLMVVEIVGEWEIYRIAVRPPFRRKGIAQQLLTHLYKECSIGDSIFLEVRDSNKSARNLYSKEGFVENGIRKNYYTDGSDAILMMKSF